MFMVDRCTNDTRVGQEPCASDHEIDEWVKDLEISNWFMYNQISWKKFGEKPVDEVAKVQGRYLMNPNYYYKSHVTIQQNKVTTYDGLFFNLYPTVSDTFWSVSEATSQSLLRQQRLFVTYYWIDQVVAIHERYVYNFINLGEDLGGIIEIMLFTLSLFVSPIATFSFNLKAIKKLFMVRTGDKTLCMNVDEQCKKSPILGSNRDYQFVIRNKDKCLLFCKSQFPACFKIINCKSYKGLRRRAKSLETIYTQGNYRVSESLNIATQIRNNRTLKILLENLILSDDIVHRIDHHDNNMIDLKDYQKNKILDAFRKGLQDHIVTQFVQKLNQQRDNKPQGVFGAFGSQLVKAVRDEGENNAEPQNRLGIFGNKIEGVLANPVAKSPIQSAYQNQEDDKPKKELKSSSGETKPSHRNKTAE